jgi:hypothetical protein
MRHNKGASIGAAAIAAVFSVLNSNAVAVTAKRHAIIG